MPTASPTSRQITALAAADRITNGQAAALIRAQRDCDICGNGMLIKPWAEVVAKADRLTLRILTSGGSNIGSHTVHVHRGCVSASPASVAEAILIALGERTVAA